MLRAIRLTLILAASAHVAAAAPGRRVRAWRADVAMTLNVMDQQVDVNGTVSAKWPNKVRMDLKMSTMPEATHAVYADGRRVYVYTRAGRKRVCTLIDAARARARLGLAAPAKIADIADPFAGLEQSATKVLGKERVADQMCEVYEVRPSKEVEGDLPFAPDRVKIWVSEETGLLVRQEMLRHDGTLLMSQEFRNVKVNPRLPDDRRLFTPPKMRDVRDLTEGATKALQGLRQ